MKFHSSVASIVRSAIRIAAVWCGFVGVLVFAAHPVLHHEHPHAHGHAQHASEGMAEQGCPICGLGGGVALPEIEARAAEVIASEGDAPSVFRVDIAPSSAIFTGPHSPRSPPTIQLA